MYQSVLRIRIPIYFGRLDPDSALGGKNYPQKLKSKEISGFEVLNVPF
jgi:hypothetical protein